MLFLGTRRQDELKDEEIQRAFNVTYALHPEKLIACVVTSDGYDRIPFIRQLEMKSRKSDRAFKMPTPNEALPQVGVFYASDAWERNQENEIEKKEPVYEPTTNDKTVRYIKHIVMNTMHRDSGNVVVGLGCLLYTYLPSKLCNLAPDLFDETNIRRDKRRITNSLKARFSNESTNIALKPADDAESTLAMKSLRVMAPWVQPHHSHSGRPSNIFETCFHRDAAPLDWVRNHMLIDPECCGIAHLIHEYNDQLPLSGVGMRLDSPENKLSVPVFNGNKSNSNDRYLPPTLSSQDKYLIRESIERNRSRRKTFVSSHIRVCVDGKETARFNASGGESHHFPIANTISYIEVFGKDEYGDLLLAFFPLPSLDCFNSEKPLKIKVQAEGGQKIHCLISPAINSDGEITSSLVQIKYQVSKLNAALIRNSIMANGWVALRLCSPRVVLTLLLLSALALNVGYNDQTEGELSSPSIDRLYAGKIYIRKNNYSANPPVHTPTPSPSTPPALGSDRQLVNHAPKSHPSIIGDQSPALPLSSSPRTLTLPMVAAVPSLPSTIVTEVSGSSILETVTEVSGSSTGNQYLELPLSSSPRTPIRPMVAAVPSLPSTILETVEVSGGFSIVKTVTEVSGSSQKHKISGVIVSREADKIIMRDLAGVDIVVNVTGSTKITEKKRNPFRSAKTYPVTALLRGLEIKVEGHSNDLLALVADKIKFTDNDYKVARLIEFRTATIAGRVTATQERVGAVEDRLSANVLHGLGDLERSQGNNDLARQHYAAARELYKKEGDKLGEANVLRGLGGLEKSQGNNDLARQHYDKGAALYASIGMQDEAEECRKLRDSTRKKR